MRIIRKTNFWVCVAVVLLLGVIYHIHKNRIENIQSKVAAVKKGMTEKEFTRTTGANGGETTEEDDALTTGRTEENKKTTEEVSSKTTGKTEPSKEDKCRVQDYNDISSIQPRIKLNPNKFLLPSLVWGPNNQLLGFLDSIVVAIKLNRTLVIPLFFKHSSDGGMNSLTSALNRIDILYLAHAISIIDLDRFKKITGGSVDVVFQTKVTEAVSSGILTGENKLGVRVIRDSEFPKGRMMPGWEVENQVGELDIDDLPKTYKTDLRTAMIVNPFQSLRLSPAEGFASQPFNTINKLTEEEILKSPANIIMDFATYSIKRPPYAVYIAADFVKKIINSDYMAVHWRYNWNLISVNCDLEKLWNIQPRGRVCGRTIQPKQMADAIAKKALEIKKEKNLDSYLPIYIAAPGDLEGFVGKVSEEIASLLKEKSPKIFLPKDLKAFVDTEYPPEVCGSIRPTENELISLLEMQLFTTSLSFLYSEDSTLSSVIKHNRRSESHPYDSPVYELITGIKKNSRLR
uniref:uncharacterized protein LOC100187397 isoform X2 n=1 Tax=Ciona intestinalis TaxID=7719 RepID=UPI000EF4E2E5|nr:uncharacterized protein LOC100187397 isoform X2 [Ciona intestinalis]|eukprot:XP_026691833.1 uncharacterized protein LOC100187397 isoform X2 [Ciona intestinalis]